MAKTKPWYSTQGQFVLGRSVLGDPSTVLGGPKRVYHDNDACPETKNVPPEFRAEGTGNLPLCETCSRLP